MPAKVAAASVIGAIAFGEPRASEAEALLDRSDISAPTLLAYELTSVAVNKARLHPHRADAVEQALSASMRLNIQWIEVDHGAVLRLALETSLSAYEASYLHIARTLQMPLATFDEPLHRVVLDTRPS